MDEIAAHVQRRLRTIQLRNNFNPSLGAIQVRGQPQFAADFAEFKALLKMVDKFNLSIAIPYDPGGLDPLGHSIARKARPDWVYFAHILGTTIWKIGHSVNPERRRKKIETDFYGHVEFRHLIEGGRPLEQRVLFHLRNYKTRDRNNPGKGEWCENLTLEDVKVLVRRVRSGERDFLDHRRPNPCKPEGPRVDLPPAPVVIVP